MKVYLIVYNKSLKIRVINNKGIYNYSLHFKIAEYDEKQIMKIRRELIKFVDKNQNLPPKQLARDFEAELKRKMLANL